MSDIDTNSAGTAPAPSGKAAAAPSATASSSTPDLRAVKARQQATWASGDFSAIAATIVLAAERLVDSADLRAGWRVLDVATGSGNAALAAARLGCEVTGCDYVPELLRRGEERAGAERLRVAFVEGDAEALPFHEQFHAVLSVYGAMFAPDHDRTASEIARSCMPAGRICLASWTPQSFVGAMFKTISAHVPPPPGTASPMLWGTESHLASIFGDRVRWLQHRRRTHTFRFRSPQQFVDFFAACYGPTLKALEALGDRGDELRSELVQLVSEWNRLRPRSGPIAVPGEYLESVGERV